MGLLAVASHFIKRFHSWLKFDLIEEVALQKSFNLSVLFWICSEYVYALHWFW